MDENAKKIDGKRIALDIKEEVRLRAEKLREAGHEAGLAVILVGSDPASKTYVRNKRRACEYCGIRAMNFELPEDTREEDLLALVDRLNHDPECHGILVQLPLPPQIHENRVLLAIDPAKDVDGFHPVNVGSLSIGNPCPKPCTPSGIIELLKRSSVPLDGAEAVVCGRSNIVGKPMAMLLLKENCTVTVAHSHTRDLREVTRRADILIAAIGKPKFFDRTYLKEGAAVIDVGMDRDEAGKLCGDVDYEDVLPLVSRITPVPGGVGPMTIAMLMKNCMDAAERAYGRINP